MGAFPHPVATQHVELHELFPEITRETVDDATGADRTLQSHYPTAVLSKPFTAVFSDQQNPVSLNSNLDAGLSYCRLTDQHSKK